MFVGGAVGLEDGVVQRCRRAAFAGYLGGDALKDLRRQMRIHQHGQLGLAEHVDEAGRDDHAVRVDGRLACAAPRVPIAAMRPSRIPMSAEYQGEPVPSMMCPLRIIRS